MNNELNTLDAMLAAYRNKEREFPSYEDLAALLKAQPRVSCDPAENEAIARDAQAIVDADVAALPADCSGTPASCPDNEGYGCACSPAAAPQVVADERRVIDCAKCEGYGATHYPDGEWEGKCGACLGTGWVSRDADIGTEQECFSCDGSGKIDDATPVQAQEPVAETYAHTMSNGRGRPDDPAPFETVCVRLLRNDLPADLKLYAAPVQPVAVPDGKYGRLTGDNVAQPVQMKGKEK